MKIKINWGTGIVIAMALFMIFILQFVFRAAVNKKYDYQLVEDDYYKEELDYQKEIDKENKANALKQNVKLIKTDKGLEIVFPSEFEFSKLKGTINLMRPSNSKLDLKKNLILTSNTYLITDKELVAGNYNIKIDWSYHDDLYLYKSSYAY